MDLSVLIPFYNAAGTIRNTLNSLLAQKDCDFSWEIVAVDDGSTDQSFAILEEYKSKKEGGSPLIRSFSFENGGVGKNRNRALEKAEGDYLIFLDADDLLLPHALKKAMDAIRKTDLSLYLFDSVYLFPDGREAPLPALDREGGNLTAEEYMFSLPCPWNKVVKRELYEKNGFRFEENILYEDLALIPALAKGLDKEKILYEKEVLHQYYQSEGSIMRSPYSEKRMDIFPALSALYRNAGASPETEYLFWLHLYRNFVWIFWDAKKEDVICKTNAFMKKYFPNWKKNPYIRKKASFGEVISSRLFYGEHFSLIRLWKGIKK